MSYVKKFQVEPGARIQLDKIDADFKPKGLDRDEAEERIRELTVELRDHQHHMYAEDQRSLLIVLQGRDADPFDVLIERTIIDHQIHGRRAAPSEEIGGLRAGG